MNSEGRNFLLKLSFHKRLKIKNDRYSSRHILYPKYSKEQEKTLKECNKN